MQTGPLFGLEISREFFRDRSALLIRTAHENGMHLWLHSCGNIELFLDDLVEIGLHLLHPVQKYAMDERTIAGRYGGRLSLWAGMDVQKTFPSGAPRTSATR